LNLVTTVAEQWAQTGDFDPLGYKPPPHADIRPEQHKAWSSARLVCRGTRWGV